MRMIDRKMENEFRATRRPAAGLLTRLRNAVFGFARAWRNRCLIDRLNELDDHRLFDMGLCRSDVQDLRAASFFSDAGLRLTITARERARRHLRSGRTD